VKGMKTLYSEVMVAGCDTPLFADDGFGPVVLAFIIVDIADFWGIILKGIGMNYGTA